MTLTIEDLKRLNMVDFLTGYYGLEFQSVGDAYVCSSPFAEDRNPSFFVRLVYGHWLFKDFSSGHGGSIIDFVRIKEKMSDIRDIISRIGQMAQGLFSGKGADQVYEVQSVPNRKIYDVKELYEQFRKADVSVCRDYLISRGIESELVEELIAVGTVVHNRYKGLSYCCFSVHDRSGELKCLDNHQIDGAGKFILGQRSIFTRDYERLADSPDIFICEGIVDYLSIKTLEGSDLPGLALLGNQLSIDAGLFGACRRIISALDNDRGGYSAVLDLMERYPEHKIEVYDLEGHKDPNELLQSKQKEKAKPLTAAKKLELYREFQRSENKAALARKRGIDRSYMYEVVKECEQLFLSALSGRNAGRKPAGQPATIRDAVEKIGMLEKNYEEAETERQRLHCRSKFLELRLKWSEIEAAELRGETVDEKGAKKKPHIKKKRKKRR